MGEITGIALIAIAVLLYGIRDAVIDIRDALVPKEKRKTGAELLAELAKGRDKKTTGETSE